MPKSQTAQKPPLPASGSDESILRDHLQKIGVLRVALLWGSQEDAFTQRECVRRLAKMGVAIELDQIHLLYRLAVRECDDRTQ